MPVLYPYKNGQGVYAKARIQNAIVTFQISDKGEAALAAAGVLRGENFPQALLLDLIRSGDAYTRAGAGGPELDDSQLELDFPKAEDLYEHLPKCEETGSALDLHLVVVEIDGAIRARTLSPESRHILRKSTLLSLPIPIITLSLLTHLESLGKLPTGSESVGRLRAWLRADRAKEWETLRNRKPARQTDLGLRGDGQGDLFEG